jgi:hypothetical protein
MNVKRTVLMVGALLTAAGAVAVAGSGDERRVDCDAYRFSSAEWRDTAGRPSPAERQARALVDCRLLVGRSRAEVREMLGAPSEADQEGFAYEVGEDALGIDSNVLDVQVQRGSTVTRAMIDQF